MAIPFVRASLITLAPSIKNCPVLSRMERWCKPRTFFRSGFASLVMGMIFTQSDSVKSNEIGGRRKCAPVKHRSECELLLLSRYFGSLLCQRGEGSLIANGHLS